MVCWNSVCTALVLEFCSLRLSYIEMTVMCMLHMHSLKVTMYYSSKFFAGNFAALYLRNYNRY